MLGLQRHLLTAFSCADARQDAQAADLHDELGHHLALLGDYSAARAHHETARDIRLMLLGPEHPATLQTFERLAGVRYAQGDYAVARVLYEHVFHIYEHILDSRTRTPYEPWFCWLACATSRGSTSPRALLYERSLDIRQRVLGIGHPDTAQSNQLLEIVRQDEQPPERAPGIAVLLARVSLS